MTITRVSILFLIYTYFLFLGTPLPILALQTIAIFAAAMGIAYIAARNRSTIFPAQSWIFFTLLAFYLTLSLIIGLERGQTAPIIMGRFLLTFLTTISLPIFAHACVRLGIFTPKALLWHTSLAAGVYSIIKFIFVIVFLITDIPQELLVDGFQTIFNTTPTLGIIAFGIMRYMTPTDFAIPLLLFYSAVYMRGFTRTVFSTAFALCIFLTYSRYIWLEALVVLALLVVRAPRKIRRSLLVLMIIAIPTLAASITSVPFIKERFSSGDTRYSDSLRTLQFDALTTDLSEHLVFGHGLASFTFQNIRDKGTPYSYELQWVSLLYQLGLVGIFILLVLVTLNCASLFSSGAQDAIPLAVIYATFLMAGFANPSLIGRAAGVGFLTMSCLSMMAKNRANNSQIKARAVI